MFNMKNKQMVRLATGLMMITFSLLPFLTMAQGDPPPDPCSDPTVVCPIDGGLYLLLAVGVVYGLKLYRDAWKKEKLTMV